MQECLRQMYTLSSYNSTWASVGLGSAPSSASLDCPQPSALVWGSQGLNSCPLRPALSSDVSVPHFPSTTPCKPISKHSPALAQNPEPRQEALEKAVHLSAEAD